MEMWNVASDFFFKAVDELTTINNVKTKKQFCTSLGKSSRKISKNTEKPLSCSQCTIMKKITVLKNGHYHSHFDGP